jgi:uncharacterized protein involved in oxidation of intracellular sulfur
LQRILVSEGVESESLHADQFPVRTQMQVFVDTSGTCLKMRNSEVTELCPLSTMQDLYEMIRGSDKVVSF